MPPVATGKPRDAGFTPGSYRIHIDGRDTDLNTIRETFGAPPFPFPIKGAAAGALSITGALEKPLFSGSVWLVDRDGCGNSTTSAGDNMSSRDGYVERAPLGWRRAVERAQCASRAFAGEYGGKPSIAALDRVPLRSGHATLEVDTLAQEIRLESVRIDSAHGGVIHGRGRISIAPDAEVNPNAIDVHLEGAGLPVKELILPYIESALINSSGGFATPASNAARDALSAYLSPLTPATANATMSGGLLAPNVDAEWQLSDGGATGDAHFSRTAMAASANSPTLRIAGKLDVNLPDALPVAARQAMTQLQATALGEPKIDAIHLDVSMKNLDGAALAAPLLPAAEASASAMADAESLTKVLNALQGPVGFLLNGDISCHAKIIEPETTGSDDTTLIAAALSRAQHAPQVAAASAAEIWQEGISRVLRQGRMNAAVELNQLRLNQLRLTGEGMRGVYRSDMSTGAMSFEARGRRLSSEDRIEVHMGERDMASPDAVTFKLQCGSLRAQAESQGGPIGAGNLLVRGLRLDDLEITSLRGNIEELNVSATASSMDMDADLLVEAPMRRVIRGAVSVLQPRFGSVRGKKLTARSSWDGSQLDLEMLRFEQNKSTYEASAGVRVPEASSAGHAGEWHFAVHAAPSVDVEEMLPALSLASEFSRLAGTDDAAGALRDFALAKERFFQHVKTAGKATVGDRLDERLASFLEALSKLEPLSPATSGASSPTASPSPANAPSLLQDLRGTWSGSLAAAGSLGEMHENGDGSFHVKEADIDVNGVDWYVDRAPAKDELRLQRVALSGAWGSEAYPEGLHVRNLAVDCGDARLRASGDVLGPSQDARLVLMELPAEYISHALALDGRDAQGTPSTLASSKAPTTSSSTTSTTAGAGAPTTTSSGVGMAAPLVSGPMYMQGEINGPQTSPQARVSAQILDGAVRGAARLGPSHASVTLMDGTRIAFEAELKPLDTSGSVRVEGSLPIVASPQPGADSVDVHAEVVDGGMDLVAAMAAPGVVQWTGGSARVRLNVLGTVRKALVDASVMIRNGALISPYLLKPIRQLNVSAGVLEDRIAVDACEARIGRHGQFRVRGGLPLRDVSSSAPKRDAATLTSSAARRFAGRGSAAPSQGSARDLSVECQGVELRIPRVLSAIVDTKMDVSGSAVSPELRGSVSLSQGSIFLHGMAATQPAAGGEEGGRSAGTAATGAAAPTSAGNALPERALSNLSSALSLKSLRTGDGERSDSAVGVVCNGLRVKLGKQVRVVFPFVLNFGARGEVVVNGGEHLPGGIRPTGTILFDNGDVNLLATQVRLAHDHIHFAAFDDDHPLDPLVDVRLVGPDLLVSLAGRASEWKDMLRIRRYGPAAVGTAEAAAGGDESGDGSSYREEMARAVEARISAGLSAAAAQRENPKALGSLAMGTLAAMLPRLETTGEFPIGLGSWRVASSPAVALGAISPGVDSGGLAGVALGLAEMEVALGRSLRGTVALTGNDVSRLASGVESSGTRWTLLYALNSKLRANLSGTSGGGTSFMIEFTPESSAASPPPGGGGSGGGF
ncbi:hypothetical protein PPROV_000194000 [Pycnococcus provasolii]|uniref:Translocation and assembly module TamB C-terminal domain-containing protein n=1 Tax=Pycnococcus provasolii TaxID=41880 RepID=A0A830H868_9CHLO|nr:hypothetical protein PPROV_000194000 [Pycnococcus provasolii]